MARTETKPAETAVIEEKEEKEISWLRALEEKVHAAAGRLRVLREENAALRQKVQDLEERLAAASSGDAAGWAEEREEIRGRVERLVDHLAELGEL